MKKLIYILPIIILLSIFSCKKEEKDDTPPVITLLGDTSLAWPRNTVWVDPGYKAVDDKDGDIADRVRINDKPDVTTDGDYYVKYNVIDEAGNMAEEKVRKVKVMIF